MYPRTPAPSHKKCPPRPRKQRPQLYALAPLAGSFKLTARKLVFTRADAHMDPPHLALRLPPVPLPPAQQDINNLQSAHLAFQTLCLETN